MPETSQHRPSKMLRDTVKRGCSAVCSSEQVTKEVHERSSPEKNGRFNLGNLAVAGDGVHGC